MISPHATTRFRVGAISFCCDVDDTGGRWVILLHGGGQTRHSWPSAYSQIAARGYSVLTYDARGHGHSDWSADSDYALTTLTDDLIAIAARLEGPIALIGASIGGLTAFGAAVGALRDRVTALILVDITLRPNPQGSARIRNFMTAKPEGFESLEAAEAVAAYNPVRTRLPTTSGLERNLRRGDDGRYHWLWDPRMLETGPNAEVAGLSDALIASAPRLKAPILLVHGAHSDVVDDAAIEEMRRLIPTIEVREVAGAGHMVAGDRNDHFLSAVTPFVEATLPSGPRDHAGVER